MNERPGLSFDDFQRWRRPIEVGFWVALVILNAGFNALVAQTDHPDVDAWKPWVWEFSSALLILALIPFVIALERRIAEAHWAPERSRDVQQSVNPMTPAQLQELAPQFNWPLFLSAQRLDALPTVIVRQTTAIQAEGVLFGETLVRFEVG